MKAKETEIFYRALEGTPDDPRLVFIWGHGWGQDHTALIPVAESVKHFGAHYLLDFNGFGKSPQPTDIWGSAEYADATLTLVEYIKTQHPNAKIIWGCHSFGGRVGLQMASRAKSPIDGMVFIGAAGLKPRYAWWKRLHLWGKVRVFKTFKFLTKFGVSEDWVIRTFTKGDYRQAGAMRKIFVKTVNEDLVHEAEAVHCPLMMVYGADDLHAFPEIGERLNNLVTGSELHILKGYDHFDILTDGRHQIASLIERFTQKHFNAGK